MPRPSGIELDPRDYDVLRFIGQQYGVPFYLLKCLLRRARPYNQGEDYTRNTNRTIGRWSVLGLVVVDIFNGAKWIRLTTAGMRYVDLPYNAKLLPSHHLKHIEAVAVVRFYLECTVNVENWIPPREYKYSYPDLEYAPDGISIIDGKVIPQEIELILKDITEKLDYYLRSFDVVWYWSNRGVHTYLEKHYADTPQISTVPIEEVTAWLSTYRPETNKSSRESA